MTKTIKIDLIWFGKENTTKLKQNQFNEEKCLLSSSTNFIHTFKILFKNL